MGGSRADVVVLTDAQREVLTRLVRAGRTAQRVVLRARIVLLAAAGQSNTAIVAAVASCADTVRKWRHRWPTSPGTASLGDAKRSGRPPRFTPVQVAQVKALACTPPRDAVVPLSRWSCPEPELLHNLHCRNEYLARHQVEKATERGCCPRLHGASGWGSCRSGFIEPPARAGTGRR